MKRKIDRAMEVFPIADWSTQWAAKQINVAHRICCMPSSWAAKVIAWTPEETYMNIGRKQGRPRLRWDDMLRKFGKEHFGHANWFLEFRNCGTKEFDEIASKYVQFCRNM